jgi:hypothetical protein
LASRTGESTRALPSVAISMGVLAVMSSSSMMGLSITKA